MKKRKRLIFLIFGFLFSKEEFLWDLGVKIQKEEKTVLSNTNKIKEEKDKSLFNEIAGLSNKLNISQNIIDKENQLLNKKIKMNAKKTSLIFNDKKNKKETQKTSSKGANAYQTGRYKDAINYLDKINNSKISKIEKNKIDYLKANAYFNLGKYEKAEEYLSKLLEQEQTALSDDALLLKGIILKEKGKKTEALNVFSQIINNHPNSEFYESAQIQKRILSKKKTNE